MNSTEYRDMAANFLAAAIDLRRLLNSPAGRTIGGLAALIIRQEIRQASAEYRDALRNAAWWKKYEASQGKAKA